ncbi:MAG TPA: PaaI family thioesterase [Ktedonobacterales bacterium]|nr:PaaI family thioesterase [Ktedonobacterales bacterium]
MTTPTTSGADIARQWLGASPFVKYLSIELVTLEPGIATLRLPYDKTMTTIGSVVHGGAIVTLMDSAGAAAAWAGADVPANIRGATVSLATTYLATAEDEDVLATARVLRRGRSLVYLDIEATTPSGKLVAKGLATYKIG